MLHPLTGAAVGQAGLLPSSFSTMAEMRAPVPAVLAGTPCHTIARQHRRGTGSCRSSGFAMTVKDFL